MDIREAEEIPKPGDHEEIIEIPCEIVEENGVSKYLFTKDELMAYTMNAIKRANAGIIAISTKALKRKSWGTLFHGGVSTLVCSIFLVPALGVWGLVSAPFAMLFITYVLHETGKSLAEVWKSLKSWSAKRSTKK